MRFRIRAWVLSLLIGTVSQAGAVWAHPQKVAITDVFFNPRSGLIEIAHRFSLHDADAALDQLGRGGLTSRGTRRTGIALPLMWPGTFASPAMLRPAFWISTMWGMRWSRGISGSISRPRFRAASPHCSCRPMSFTKSGRIR